MVTKSEFPDPKAFFESLMSGPMKESAQQIWLAGLGAFAKAQQEGGRLFETLVKEGAELHKRGPMDAGAQFAQAAAKAAQPLEALFEERVAKALARLGTPTADEVAALRERIDHLEKIKPVAAKKRAPARRKL